MTRVESVKLVAVIAVGCPQQRVEDGTADIWHYHLADITWDDGYQAAMNLIGTQRFIALNELLDEARRVERTRLGQQRHLELAAQHDDPDGEPLPLGHPKRQHYADKVRRALNASRSLATPNEITE